MSDKKRHGEHFKVSGGSHLLQLVGVAVMAGPGAVAPAARVLLLLELTPMISSSHGCRLLTP